MNLAAILQLATAAAPQIANLILMIRNKNGGVTVIATLDEADAQIESNQQQIRDWFAQHNLQPPAAAQIPPKA